MIRVVLKGLAGRKVRTALTAIAIVLGVAMVSGAYVFTDRIDKAIDTLFTGAYRGSDAVISGNDIVQSSASGDGPCPPSSWRRSLRSRRRNSLGWDPRRRPTPRPARHTHLHPRLRRRGQRRRQREREPVQSPELTAGRWPHGRRRLRSTAGRPRSMASTWATPLASPRWPRRQFTIAGIAEFVGLRSTGQVTLAIFDLPTAQDVFDKPGQLDEILVAAADGVTQEPLVEQLRSIVPAGAEVVTGPAQVQAESSHTDKQVAVIQKVLLAFGGIAVFVGAFVIFNTFSITIAERTRELATLRTLGASRHQVLASVVVESVLIGLLASVAGLFLGLGLAKALAALSVAAGTDLQTAAPCSRHEPLWSASSSES